MTPDERLTVLQLLVKMEMWRDQPIMLEAIYVSYLDIVSVYPLQQCFGTPVFWKAVREMYYPTPPPPPQLPSPSTSTDDDYSSEDEIDSV